MEGSPLELGFIRSYIFAYFPLNFECVDLGGDLSHDTESQLTTLKIEGERTKNVAANLSQFLRGDLLSVLVHPLAWIEVRGFAKSLLKHHPHNALQPNYGFIRRRPRYICVRLRAQIYACVNCMPISCLNVSSYTHKSYIRHNVRSKAFPTRYRTKYLLLSSDS